jgi:hypothetical protein
MANHDIRLRDANIGLGVLNVPSALRPAIARSLADNDLGDDGTEAFPVDANGARMYRDDILGTGVPKPVTIPERVVQLLRDPAAYRRLAWLPYGAAVTVG